ncbi:hypothetical protein [Actinoplanes sp. NPDC049681]|uniref:hypothetical protein n=1 Tax=Actinoplanes sp. NPDC049681 TaxID=3363905 RepID=UPI00379CAD0B
MTSAPGLDRVTAAMAKAAPAAGTFVGYAAATPVFVPFERSCSDRDDFIDGGVLLGIRPAVGVAACDRPAGGDAPVAARLVRAEWC